MGFFRMLVSLGGEEGLDGGVAAVLCLPAVEVTGEDFAEPLDGAGFGLELVVTGFEVTAGILAVVLWVVACLWPPVTLELLVDGGGATG